VLRLVREWMVDNDRIMYMQLRRTDSFLVLYLGDDS
jgi:hypothetical protein